MLPNLSLSKRLKLLLNHVANPKPFVPIITISPTKCKSLGCYETVQFYEQAYSHKQLHQNVDFKYPIFDFDQYQYSACTFKEGQHGTKCTIIKYIRYSMIRPAILHHYSFTHATLQTIISSAHLKRWLLLKVTSNNEKKQNLNFPLYFIVCLKNESERTKKKTIVKGKKLDIEMIISDNEWNKMSFAGQLYLFAWCYQFGKYIQKYKWNAFSTTTSAFFYKAIYADHPTEYNYLIRPIQIKLGQNTSLIDYNHYCRVIQPGINYDPFTKRMPYIDSWLLANNKQKIEAKFLPIAHKCYLKVINSSIANKLLKEYECWVNSNTTGHHERLYANSNPNSQIKRIKSYIHKKYWYPSKKYNDAKAKYDKAKKKGQKCIKLAHKNVADGLRIIDPNEPKPQFILNLWPLLSMMPHHDFFDQIGINLYKYSGDDTENSVSFAGISSHDEWKKFAICWQLTAGVASLLTIDGGGGDVDATVGLELPSCALIQHDMKSYFQCGSKFGGGGKHSIARRHLILRPGQWRLTFLFRRCTEDANDDAWRHWRVCNNNDEYCFCVNPHLRPKD